MRAALIIPRQKPIPCGSVRCLSLFPLVDRPILQHVVEAIAGRGITDIHVVCSQHSDAIEQFLGDGSRWGCSFSYHLVRDPERPASVLRAMAAHREPVLVASADELPALPASLSSAGKGMLFGTQYDWSGWAVIDSSVLEQVPAVPLSDLFRFFSDHGARWVIVDRLLVLRSLADVPAARERLLRGEVNGALLSARESRRGVLLARNVRLAPSARLVPPVYVGENTVIAAGATVGPLAVIGADCLIDRNAAVHDSTVCAGTYVGPGVELSGAIAERRSLVNPYLQTATTVESEFLDDLVPALPRVSALWRLPAAATFVIALPILLAVAFWKKIVRGGPVLWPRRFVPAASAESGEPLATVYTLARPREGEDETGWVIPATMRGILLEFLPALWSVARGDLRLVGIPPRGDELLQAHGAACPSLLRAPPGLITEAALWGREGLTQEECLLVDGYQAKTSSPLVNLKRACRFLFRAMTGRGTPVPEPLLPAALEVSAPAHRSESFSDGYPRPLFGALSDSPPNGLAATAMDHPPDRNGKAE